MTKTAAPLAARLALIALIAIAFMLGLGAINEANAMTTTAGETTTDLSLVVDVPDMDDRDLAQVRKALDTPVIEAGIPADQECVLRNADGTPYRVVADTDPRCKVQGQEAQPVRTIVVVSELATIETTPVVCTAEQGPADGAFRWETCTPEESPNGGHVTAQFEDGGARYSDGWTIAPKKDVKPSTTGAVLGAWKAPKA